MTIAELRQRWQERAGEWRRLHVSVDGAALADELLADLEQLECADDERLFTPTQAALRTGFHPESIARMVRKGRVPNHGTKHRPRVKLSELPKKAPKVARRGQAGASSAAADTASITRDALALRIGR